MQERQDPLLLVTGPDPQRFQGGISRFSKLLATHLKDVTRSEFVGWRRPYPNHLLPKATTGPEDFPHLDVLSPSTWTAFADQAKQRQVDAVILNWVHPVQSLAFASLIKKLKPLPTWVVCHNVYPHEKLPGARTLLHFALKESSGLVVHSEPNEHQAREIFPKLKILSLSLPPLDDYSMVRRDQARSGVELLCFGHLRPYKGIETLLTAFSEVKKVFPEARLTIAGKPLVASVIPGGKKRYLKALNERKRQLRLDDSVQFLLEYLPDDKLRALFEASDLAVFPFHEVTASASVLTALSAGVPVVASDLPGLSEVVLSGKNGFLAEAKNPESLSSAIVMALRSRFDTDVIRGSLAKRSWNQYCQSLGQGIFGTLS